MPNLVGYNSNRLDLGPRHERTDARQGVPARHPQSQQEGGNHIPDDRRLTHKPEAADCRAITISVHLDLAFLMDGRQNYRGDSGRDRKPG